MWEVETLRSYCRSRSRFYLSRTRLHIQLAVKCLSGILRRQCNQKENIESIHMYCMYTLSKFIKVFKLINKRGSVLNWTVDDDGCRIVIIICDRTFLGSLWGVFSFLVWSDLTKCPLGEYEFNRINQSLFSHYDCISVTQRLLFMREIVKWSINYVFEFTFCS